MLVPVEHCSQDRSLVQPTSDKHHLLAMETGTLFAWETLHKSLTVSRSQVRVSAAM